ncbi:transcription termination/antitermination protein NusG [Rickettsia prowazekii]|uniref:Transcription termination/antitermination protein NusG n=2 Tax=Rickettsia prowazekii TaxID=782 RepID=NUSG_RICPR|nr:transcription termination/antitermination protein NusG [Rickettsia prowazekii]P50056.1 RecName: Full=Transcription termination/antitermination protein NusG [Rickettsia prowazekii str. Madrid E]EOB10024.1 Preprotein translocase subunit SecE [Rickettsia prowazekii str. GvF12]ADE29644.1 Transcription antitermination protein NusG [Rickettsia prowazekii str. Rp22]AFE48958.1 transcription antitermination protein NusG [Rickettsia prowazekii str. Chernikova]AFE49803.1 transcription antitermination 
MTEQTIDNILPASKNNVKQWYVVHTASGAEKRIKEDILRKIAKQKMTDFFEDILIPVFGVSEVKRGKNVKVEKKLMPSYILIKMNMTDKSWHLVKNIPGVTGFLGSKIVPKALTESEIQNIFNNLEAEAKVAKNSKLYEVGEIVTVTDGPFETFMGTVEAIDKARNRLKVSVSIFGKATPIELNFNQVKKSD